MIGVASNDGVKGGVVHGRRAGHVYAGGRSRAGCAEGRALGDAGKMELDRIALDPWGRFALRRAGLLHIARLFLSYASSTVPR